MRKPLKLVLIIMLLAGSITGGIRPVIAETDETIGDITEVSEEPVENLPEEPVDTESSEEPESPVDSKEAFWTLRYDLGESGYYDDGRPVEKSLGIDDSDPFFTLYEFPVREGYAPDGWNVFPENDPDHRIVCDAGDTLDPSRLCETGGVIVAEARWLKLFTVTVHYELNCPDAQLEEPWTGTSLITFENKTKTTFDICLNAHAEGKVFAGWTEDLNSGVILNDAEAVQELADRIIEQNLSEITLYGVWEDNSLEKPELTEKETIFHVVYRTIDPDCVFADAESFEWEQGLYAQCEYHEHDEVVIDQDVTREGFVLTGWALSPEEAAAGTPAYHNGDATGKLFESTDGDLVLYAVWEAPKLYTLRFYVNGGVIEDTPANKKGIAVTKIASPELDSIVIAKNGYHFDGWFSDSKLKKKVTAEMFEENPKNMSLYAKWSPKTYRIYFDLNDEGKEGAVMIGADPVGSEDGRAVKEGFVFNTKKKLTPKAKAPGYTFLGWSRDQNASAAKYKSGKSYKNYSPDGEDVTLYAVWKPNTYKLKIYVNGGRYSDVSSLGLKPVKIRDGVVNTTYTVEDDRQMKYVTIPMNYNEDSSDDVSFTNFFTKPGYTFAGWYKDKKLTKKIENDAQFQTTGNYTVYAKWTGVQYTVRLHANGETAYFSDAQGNRVSSMDQTVTYNKKARISEVPVKEGYTFLGWSLNPEGSAKTDVKYTRDKTYKRFGTVIPEAGDTVDLYAVWKKKPGTIESGLNYVTYNGVKLAVYRAEEGYSLQMLSAGEGQLKTIKRFSSPELDIHAMVNANYFQMRQDTADPYGTHYGVEQTYDSVDLAPKRKGLICYFQTNDGEINWMTSDQYYLQNSDVIFACTPYSVLRHKGVTVNVRSYLLSGKEDTAAYQTMIMRVGGVWHLVVSRTQTYPRVMRQYAELLNAEEAILMDGGGSSQMLAYADSTYKEVQYTGRAIPNVLCIAKEK